MAFNAENYVWPPGKENHLPPPCYGKDLNDEDRAKFDSMAIHIINTKLEAGRVPFRVAKLYASHDSRCRAHDKCHWVVMLRHKTNPNYNYHDDKRNALIARDVKEHAPSNVSDTSHAQRVRETFPTVGAEDSDCLMFSFRCKCRHNQSVNARLLRKCAPASRAATCEGGLTLLQKALKKMGEAVSLTCTARSRCGSEAFLNFRIRRLPNIKDMKKRIILKSYV